MEVGQKLLQSMKDIEKAIGETGLHFRFNTLSIQGEDFRVTLEGVQPFMDSLLEAGFTLDKKELTSYEVQVNYKHKELHHQHSVCISYRPSAIEELESLKSEQQKIEQKIEKLKEKL